MTDSFLPKTHFTEHRKEYTEADVRLTIEAHEAELRRQHEVIQTLTEALTESRRIVDDCLKAFGDCDHEVGICNCDMKKSLKQSDAALNKAKEKS